MVSNYLPQTTYGVSLLVKLVNKAIGAGYPEPRRFEAC